MLDIIVQLNRGEIMTSYNKSPLHKVYNLEDSSKEPAS